MYNYSVINYSKLLSRLFKRHTLAVEDVPDPFDVKKLPQDVTIIDSLDLQELLDSPQSASDHTPHQYAPLKDD